MHNHKPWYISLLVVILLSATAAAGDWRQLLNRADSLANVSEVDSALAVGNRALDLAHAESDTAAASVLRRLSVFRYYDGDYEQAERVGLQCLQLREEAYGPNHPEVAIALRTLGVMLLAQSKYDEAEDAYTRARDIFESAEDYDPVELAALLDNLGILYYYYTGDLDRAETVYRRSLDIKWHIDSMSSDVALTMNNLGDIYRNRGEYVKADELLQGALTRFRATLPANHGNIADVLDVLALVNSELLQYERAERLAREALAIRESSFGESHPDLIGTLDALALALSKQEEYEDAVEVYLQVIDIARETTSDQRESEALLLNNLGNTYVEQRRYADGLAVYRESMAIKRELVGESHPWIASSLLNIGNAAFHLDSLELAESSLQQSLAILDRVYGGYHHDQADVLANLSKLRRAQGRTGDAVSLAERAFLIQHRHFHSNAFALSEEEALRYSEQVHNAAGNFISSAVDAADWDSATTGGVAAAILATKGAVSDEVFRRTRAMREQPDADVQRKLDSLRAIRRDISSLFVAGPEIDSAAFACYLDTLGRTAESLEQSLARMGGRPMLTAVTPMLTPKKIAATLPDKSALLEYYRYLHIDVAGRTAWPAYAVLVVRDDAPPLVKYLGRADQIDHLQAKYREHMQEVALQLLAPDAYWERYVAIADSLYTLLWSPVAEAVDGAGLVLIAPDGGLSTVSFAGLARPDGPFLAEQHAIHYLTAGRDLLRDRPGGNRVEGLLAIGDPDFDASVEQRHISPQLTRQAPAQKSLAAKQRRISSPCRNLDEITVSPLPGTRHEIDRIVDWWRSAIDEPVASFLGPAATEERCKRLGPSHRVVHLATHGYYLQAECEATTDTAAAMVRTANPLLLSGLFLAGSNLHGKDAAARGAEDGVLTAFEVAGMSLDATDLVVLSACETGLGQVVSGEGVYGLRRAFLMAGARTVVCALWPVDDVTTASLISPLYNHADRSVAEALRTVQLDMISALRQNGLAPHPCLWSSFITVGDW